MDDPVGIRDEKLGGRALVLRSATSLYRTSFPISAYRASGVSGAGAGAGDRVGAWPPQSVAQS
jgi:hypothetical protein